jgi:hypothetical protein
MFLYQFSEPRQIKLFCSVFFFNNITVGESPTLLIFFYINMKGNTKVYINTSRWKEMGEKEWKHWGYTKMLRSQSTIHNLFYLTKFSPSMLLAVLLS